MGPRSTDRGNLRLPGGVLFDEGLLQWGRDRLIAEIRRTRLGGTQSGDASMGPRSTDRGNISVRTAQIGDDMLQWGRDRLIAEMISACKSAPMQGGIQWGRDRLIAEIRAILILMRTRCSRQWGRDRLIAEMTQTSIATPRDGWLQWGRDRLIAEMCFGAETACRMMTGLQWGRDRLIAEMRADHPGSATLDGASMGPRSTDRGNRG